MKLGTWTAPLVLTLFVGGCVDQGDFCDIARPLYLENESSVDWLLDNEPGFAEDVLGHNVTGERSCNWSASDA